MKPITIEGEKFEYEIMYLRNGCWLTRFYKGTELRKKYGFFGNKIEFPKLIFKIYEDIENPNHTKERIKKLISHQLELINRKEEIERGEII